MLPENIDKRKYRRAKCEFVSTFKNITRAGAEPLAETTAIDISEGGFRFRSNHFIPVRERLMFKVNIPKRKPIEVIAQPAWIRELPNIGQYDIGGSFLSLSSEDQALIREFLQDKIL